MKHRILINLCVFMGVFGLLCYWAVNNIISIDALEEPYSIEGDFAATAGLASGSEITYLGVHFGTVSGVDLNDDGVRIKMSIDRDLDIPVGTTARVLRKSAIGEPYIDLVPPAGFDPSADGVEYLDDGPGVELPIESTSVPLEFSELLRSASDILSRIDPASVNTLVTELATALDGRGDDLRRITEGFDTLTATFAARTEVLDRLAVNNTRLATTFANHAGALGESLTNLSELAESLAAARGDVQRLLDSGPEFLGVTGDLLAGARADLDCLLGNLVTVNEALVTDQRIADLEYVLNEGPRVFADNFLTRHVEADGVWVRVSLTLALEDPAPQYTTPLTLPEVPTVGACPGTSASSGSGSGGLAAGGARPDFLPSSVLGRDSRLPATGTALAVGSVAAVLMAAALFLRWTTRAGRAEA